MLKNLIIAIFIIHTQFIFCQTKYKILNADFKNAPTKIKGVQINFNTNSNGQLGTFSKTEIINYKRKFSKFTSDKLITKVEINKQTTTENTNFNHSFRAKELEQIITDVYNKKISLAIQMNDSIKIIYPLNKKTDESCLHSMLSSHPTYYTIDYFIFTKSDTVKLNYFIGDEGGLEVCPTQGNLLLDWLYMYKLLNLSIANNKTTKQFFTEQKVNEIIKWTKKD